MQTKRRWRKALAAIAAAAALAVALPGSALALGGGSSGADMGASWNVPTTPMTNTVEKDGKEYKVVTTWAMAWSTSGPDFVGINNSSFYGNGGNGNANVTNTEFGRTSTLVGIWASDANESPNAFNWNTFYNLYAEEQAAEGNALDKTDLACTTPAYDSSSGVWGPFKYRPEIIWLCNNLNAAQTEQYVGEINAGKYRSGVDEGGDNVFTTGADDPAAAEYYVEGDESYSPIIIQPVNSSPYTFVDSAYEIAGYAEDVIAATADKPGLADGEELSWKTMNKLPRATRYAESANDCALNIERLARGSAYYALKMINEGAVQRKKVAFVDSVPNANGNDATHVTVRVYDYIEDIMGSGGVSGATMHGRASWSPLAVDQLGPDDGLAVREGGDHAVVSSTVGTDPYTNVERPLATNSTYIATADDLLKADVIYAARQSLTVQQWKDFLETATTDEARAKIDTVQIIAGTPYVTNGSNFTMDKMIYGAFAMDCFYPELFPNMENCTFWYNKIYHIKNQMLGSAMTWAFGTATLPSDQELLSSDAAAAYDASATIAKYDAGLGYFNGNGASDPTISRILANTALDGSTQVGEGDDAQVYNYSNFEPSAYWQEKVELQQSEAADSQAAEAAKAQIEAAVASGDAAAVAAARAAYNALTDAQKALVGSESVAALEAAEKALADAKPAAKKANPLKATAKAVKAKAKKLKKKAMSVSAISVSGAQGAVSYKIGKISTKKKLAKQAKKKIKVKSDGKIQLGKKLKKGTYKVPVTVTAAGNSGYNSGSVTVTVKVKVK